MTKKPSRRDIQAALQRGLIAAGRANSKENIRGEYNADFVAFRSSSRLRKVEELAQAVGVQLQKVEMNGQTWWAIKLTKHTDGRRTAMAEAFARAVNASDAINCRVFYQRQKI